MSGSSKKKIRKEENAAQLAEKQQKELKDLKKLRIQTIAFVAAVSLVLVIGLGALCISAYKNSGIAERSTIALNIGDQALTTADLSYFYIDNINSTHQEWQQTYGEGYGMYLSALYQLDITKPLGDQAFMDDSKKTYADYFIDMAIDQAVSAYAMYAAAEDNGFKLDDDAIASIDGTIAALELSATRLGYRNIDEYLKTYYGKGATKESFHKYIVVSETAAAYATVAYDNFTYTDSDLEAYDAEHFYELSSYSYDTFYLPANRFIQCTADENDKDHEHTQEELDAAQKLAKKAADALVAAKPKTEKDFNAAIQKLDAFKESTCTVNKDCLYSDVANVDIAEWIAKSERKAGDMIIVSNDTETTDADGNAVTKFYGYTVAVYRGRNDNYMKLVNVRHVLKAFEGSTTDELGNVTYPAGSFEKAKDAIVALEQTWINEGGTEEAFIKLAEENTDDTASAQVGGLYENIYPGQMVPSFNDWSFDESRIPGDYAIVESQYGFHLLYFVGESDVTYRDYMIENTLREADFQKWYDENISAAKYAVVDTSKMDTDIILEVQ